MLKMKLNKSNDKIDNQDKSFNRKESKPKWRNNFKSKKSLDRQQPKSKTLLVKPGTLWTEKSVDLNSSEYNKSPPAEVETLRQQAEKLLEDDIANYKIFLTERKEKADFGWIQTVLKSGTLADKMAAHTMLVQDSPVHCLASVDMLSGLVNTKGKRECILAMDTLRDLFLSNLLVEDRKLKAFDTRPLSKLNEISGGNKETKSRQLLLWCFEDHLKKTYKNFLHALETVTHDQVEKTKEKAISVLADLLMHNSEQEQYLLQKLVNKIGDPVNRISGKVVHLLNKVVDCHPNMKLIIVEEVERLLFRPNIGAKAQYYALCFLNQLILSPDDVKLAAHLIKVYFAFFKVCVKKGAVDSKMMSALLTGTSRAFPFAKKDNTNELLEQLDTLFKVVHIVNFNTSVQCLMLIFQALDTNDGPSDRFYSTLYKMILDPDLSFSTRQTMFLNLLFRSIKKDPVERRVKAFYKRLLQACHYFPPPLVCGFLFLISETLKLRPNLLSFTQNYVIKTSDSKHFDDEDDEDEHYSDVPLEEDEETIDKKEIKAERKKVKPSWVHLQTSKIKSNKSSSYRPSFWNPLYCGAENEASWELTRLVDHFHPSVSLFATNLVQKKSIHYSGDPLQDFTLIHFLDRFVFRNPKKATDRMKEDLHQRVFGRRKFYAASGSRSMSLSSESYLHQKEENIPVEEKFMYRYLLQQAEKKKKKKLNDDDDDEDDVESVASEDFEKLLDKLEPGSWDNIDFASEVQKGGKKAKADEDEDEDELSDDDFENDEDFKQAFEEYDEELEGLDEEDFVGGKFEESELEEENCEEDDNNDEADGDFDLDEGPKKRPAKRLKRERAGKRRKINDKFDTSNMFAAAEEFADLLEENADTKLDTIGSQALSNKDKADVKQLNWEVSRDKWVKGVDWKKKKNFKGNKMTKSTKGSKKFKGKKK